MASPVEQIAVRLRQALDRVDVARGAVARGLGLIGRAAGSFAQVMRGSDAAVTERHNCTIVVNENRTTPRPTTTTGGAANRPEDPRPLD